MSEEFEALALHAEALAPHKLRNLLEHEEFDAKMLRELFVLDVLVEPGALWRWQRQGHLRFREALARTGDRRKALRSRRRDRSAA